MTNPNQLRYFCTSGEIARLTILQYVKRTLFLRNIEGLPHQRVRDVNHYAVRFWWPRVRVFDKSDRACSVMSIGSPRTGTRAPEGQFWNVWPSKTIRSVPGQEVLQ